MNSELKDRQLQIGVALLLTVAAICSRLLPHPANFAPLMAATIFAGSVLPRRLALSVPLAAVIISDLVIGFYSIMPIVWACYLIVALASSQWLRHRTLLRGAVFTAAGSLFFFIVTNFAVWVFGGMYAHTGAGLAQCYWLALPFFRNSLLSDLFYTGALFSVWNAAPMVARLLTQAAPAR